MRQLGNLTRLIDDIITRALTLCELEDILRVERVSVYTIKTTYALQCGGLLTTIDSRRAAI